MINFSVIIPNFNHAPFLQQRIDSVLAQIYPHFELIIIDDCSSDSSATIIGKYRENKKVTHIVHNSQNSGSPFKPWATGLALAKYDWIWIAESDDFADPAFLKEAAEAIAQHPSVGLFYCDSYTVDEENVKGPRRYAEIKNEQFNTQKWSESYFNNGIDELNECLKYGSTINNVSSMVFQKHLLVPVIAGLNHFYLYGDFLFFVKASVATNIFYSSKPLNYYRIHSGSHLHLKTTIVKARSEHYRILDILYGHKLVTNKTHLLNHYVYNYLSFGIIEDGLRNGYAIIRFYFRHNPRLAWKVLIRIIYIKLFRIKRAFWEPLKAK